MNIEFEEGIVADVERDRQVESIFNAANKRIAGVVTQMGLPRLQVVFNPPPTTIITPAALGEPPVAIAIYLRLLRNFDVNPRMATGILAHEYGHLYYWALKDRIGLIEWELAADRFSGWMLRRLRLSLAEAEAFLTKFLAGVSGCVPIASRLIALREGYAYPSIQS